MRQNNIFFQFSYDLTHAAKPTKTQPESQECLSEQILGNWDKD